MRVIAGVCGPGSSDAFEQHCRRALSRQERFAISGDIEISHSIAGAIGSTDGGLARDVDNGRRVAVLVADARLDDRSGLAESLALPPELVARMTDADLMLQAWLAWGEGAPNRLVGVFAFAVVDPASTYLVRDPLGERPLNYGLRGRCLSFASMPGGVWPDRSLAPDLDVLVGSMRNQLLSAELSLYEGIKRVPAGSIVKFSGTSLTSQHYWRPKMISLPRSHDDLTHAFRSVFDEAVASRMDGRSAPCASMLSSGFDSSTVTGTAARLLERPDLLTAYTSAPAYEDKILVPRSRFADESPIASETAFKLGIHHRVIRDRRPILSSMRGLSSILETPVPNPLNVFWWRAILDQVRMTGGTSILVATEGNVTISYGGTVALPAFVRSGHILRWLRELHASIRNHRHLRWRGALFASFEPWLPQLAVNLLRHSFNRKVYWPEFDFVRTDVGGQNASTPAYHPSGNLVADRLSLLNLHDNGERFKGMFALTGVEERDPTADRRVIDFCLSMQPEHLLSNGEPRPIAREAFSDRVNPRVFSLPVRGYQSADWYGRMLKSEALEILSEIKTTSAANLIDFRKLEAAIEHWPPFNPDGYATLFPFGRSVSSALNFGLFLAETERSTGATSDNF